MTKEPAVEALMAVSRLTTAVVARTLAEAHASVTTPQLRVLVMLSSQGPLNLARVAHGLGVNASGASRTCERLVAADLVSRRDDPADRRQLILDLTSAGAALVDRLMDERRQVFAQVIGTMSVDDRRGLAAGLEAFLRAASDVAASDDLADGEGSLLRWLA